MKKISKYGNRVLENAYEKYNKKQKISYEEYVVMLATNDEIWFFYNNREYQVIHESENITTMCITRYEGTQEIFESYENFSSVIELLEKFKISGKLIKEIWSDVTF